MAEVDALHQALMQELAEAQPEVDAPTLALGGWFDRILAASHDRAAWLEARRHVVTATEVAELLMHAAPFRATIIQKKLAPPVELHGKYIDRGHEREPVIGEWVTSQWPGIRGSDLLLVAAENARHAATPDLLGSDGGELVCGDIKTSKHDLRPSRADGYFWRTHYFGQLQWQMYVTGTRRALFVWERHDDAWPHPEPTEMEPEWEWVARDDAYIARAVAAADALLADLDKAVALRDAETRASDIVEVEPLQAPVNEALERRRTIAGLGLAVLDARVAEAEVKARKDAPWAQLQTLLASSRSDVWEDGQVRVTWTNEEKVETVPDEQAALAAHVNGLDDDVTGEDLKADLDRARVAWEAHQAKFRTERTTAVRRLTVTAVKAAKEKK